jgi:hypothetical protein
MTKKPHNRPSWICDDCGQLYGKWYQGNYTGPAKHYATYHVGNCDICSARRPVTEPRDYGHVVKDWKIRYEKDLEYKQQKIKTIEQVK